VLKAASLGILVGALTPVLLQGQTAPPASVATTAASKLLPLNARRLAPESAYARVYCIVPLVGSGSLADPMRPMFAPGPPTAAAPLDRTGIIAYQFQISDDGNHALVEFVAVARSGLGVVLTSTNPDVIFFERGKYTRQQIETAFQQYKKSFSFNSFTPVKVL
jgi:hypothetical protein